MSKKKKLKSLEEHIEKSTEYNLTERPNYKETIRRHGKRIANMENDMQDREET